MTRTCPECSRAFPAHLLSEMAIGSADPRVGLEYVLLCPLCALQRINQTAGLPEGTPFRGPHAVAMHAEALRYLEAKPC